MMRWNNNMEEKKKKDTEDDFLDSIFLCYY